MADSQAAFVDALAVRLRSEHDVEVVGVATSTAELDSSLAASPADVLVTDLRIDGPDLGSLARLRRAHPRLRIVVLSAVEDPAVVVAALRIGASAVLAKEATIAELMAAVRGSLRNETFVSPRLLTGAVAHLLGPMPEPTDVERRLGALTARERDVLQAMVAGQAPAAIARQLVLSTSTVRTHARRVREKLGVHSTLEAVSVARRAGVRPRRPA